MLDLLAGLMLLQTAAKPFEASSVYTQETLSGFVAIENSRAVDGINYGDGEGVLSAGWIFATPGGFFVGSELLSSHGDGTSLPSESILALQTFAGYSQAFGEHRFAVELLDYRFDAGEIGRFNHQGIGLRYRHGALQVELAHERAKPYFYAYRNRYFPYDLDRLAVGWQQAFSGDFGWSLGAGAGRIGRIDIDYRFFTGSLHGRFQRLHWQVGYVHASEELESFYHGIDRSQLLLRIAVPFRVF
ncbi:MAG TPA: hypothetical protein VF275_12020 [Gammaproteobacteria bacterium]